MPGPADSIAGFPDRLPEPASYYHGVDAAARVRSRNAVVFLRTSRGSLQQRNFAHRVHHRHVLMLVLETPGKVSLDGQVHALRPGQALLVLPYQFHHYIDLVDEALRWLFVTFELDDGAALATETGNLVLHPDAGDLALWRGITGLWQRADSPGRGAELLAMLDQLLTRLHAGAAAPLPQQGSAASRGSWIARVEGLIAESVMQGRTLESVARKAGLSARHLRTRFEAEMGVSIRRYKATYQLNRAASLLRQPELPLGRVAELCGFNSQAVFSRFIRRETGLTPSAWRRSLGS